jgi:hypothetical protein
LNRGQSANNHHSNGSNRSSSSASASQTGHTPQPAPSDTPLEGLIICLPSRVIGNHQKMQDMIIQMGARHISSYSSSATHLIHKGKATPDATRNLRAARKDKLFIVSPDWLFKCQETGLRVNECEYPETYDKRLTLSMTPASNDRPEFEITLKSSQSPTFALSGPASAGAHKRSPSAIPDRSVISGSQYYRFGAGQPSSSQKFQGTAAGATSALFGGDSDQPSSTNNSTEPPLNGTVDTYSHQ